MFFPHTAQNTNSTNKIHLSWLFDLCTKYYQYEYFQYVKRNSIVTNVYIDC